MSSTVRLKVPKTIKLYINGQFPRTESGRSYPIYFHGQKEVYANACLGSRKDVRAAVEAAKKALPGWCHKTAFLRSQILYRMAEMTESKRLELAAALVDTLGLAPEKADQSVEEAIATFIYYAGFADKFSQVIGSINPVAGPYHNFTAPEPVGIVGIIGDNEFDFVKIVDQISSVICSGNTAVVLLGKPGAVILASLAEVFATSDLPAGVVNLISGDTDELYPHLGGHMEVHSVTYLGDDKKLTSELKILSIENMKRVIVSGQLKSLDSIVNFTEYKTVWHPVGL